VSVIRSVQQYAGSRVMDDKLTSIPLYNKDVMSPDVLSTVSVMIRMMFRRIPNLRE